MTKENKYIQILYVRGTVYFFIIANLIVIPIIMERSINEWGTRKKLCPRFSGSNFFNFKKITWDFLEVS